MPTIPAATLCRAVAHILSDRRAELRRIGGTGSVAAGRQRNLQDLGDQLRQVGSLLARGPQLVKGDVDCAIAGLVCAWACGYQEALGDLERLLQGQKHPAAEPLTRIKVEDLAAGLRLLFDMPPIRGV